MEITKVFMITAIVYIYFFTYIILSLIKHLFNDSHTSVSTQKKIVTSKGNIKFIFSKRSL